MFLVVSLLFLADMELFLFFSDMEFYVTFNLAVGEDNLPSGDTAKKVWENH